MKIFISDLLHLDTKTFYVINKWFSCWLFDVTMPVLTDLHKSTFAVCVIVVAVLSWIAFKGRRALAISLLIAFATGSADVVNAFAIKQEFRRERPQFVLPDVRLRSPVHYGYSFPSNHATNCFTIATIVASAFPAWAPIAFFGAIAVAFSRVYVGVHFPLDVLGSAIVGILLGRLFWLFGRRVVERQEFHWGRPGRFTT